MKGNIMKKILILLFTISILVLTLISCDKTKNSENQDVIVPESTEILSTEEANSSIDQIDGDYIFVNVNSNLAGADIGNIILSDDCNAAPGGLLKRILSKSTVDDQVVFETEQASLAEAVQEMTLSESYQLTPDDVKKVQLFNGCKYKPEKNGLEFPVEIDCILYDNDGNYSTTDDQILLSGDLLFTAELFTVIEISWFELTKFEIGIESDRNADLYLTANFHWEFEEELTLEIAQFNFSPITFMVGLVPVVIIPTLEVEAHVHGDLTVTFTTGITYTEEIRYGIGYQNEEWYQINENEKSFYYSPPEFTTEFNFETGASLKLSTLIYGVGGPYVQAKAGLQFQSVLEINPTEMHLNFDLQAILYALCGVYIEALDITFVDEYLEFILYTHPIGEWEIPFNQAPNQPSNPSPSDNATNASVNTNLSWSCSDPDNDPLNYDVYFGTNSNPPLANTGQSSSNYDPGTLNEGTTYYWKIVANDDHENSTTGVIWQFATTDPSPDFITVSSPNGGETWEMGTSHNITWTDNISSNVKIELFKSGSYYKTITSSTSSDGSYSWSIPTNLVESSNYKVKIASTTNSSLNDYSNSYFTIENQTPADYITVTSPNGGETWKMGTSHNITWDDNISSNVKIELYKSGSYYITISSSTSSDGSYIWSIPTNLTESSSYKVKITSATNNSVNDYSNGNFTIEDELALPDLIVESVNVDIDFWGSYINIAESWTVKNIGADMELPGYWWVSIYWSEDNILNQDEDDLLVQTNFWGDILLSHNETYTIEELNIPYSDYIYGSQYLIFEVYTLPDSNYDNNTLAYEFTINPKSFLRNNSIKPIKNNDNTNNQGNE